MSTLKMVVGIGAGVATLAAVAYVAYNKGYEDGMEPVSALTAEELAAVDALDLLDKEPVTTTG